MVKEITKVAIALIAFIFAGSANCMADDIDYAHWMRQLCEKNPDIRVSQLSIPWAHDAATHTAHLSYIKDQSKTEKYLFEHGVRAFDMRICYDGTDDVMQLKDGSWMSVGHMRHGDTEFCNLNNFKQEMSCLPDSTELEGETMFLCIQYESGDKVSEDQKMDAYENFMYFITQKYGSNPDMYVKFRPDMTLKELLDHRICIMVNEYGMSQSTYKGIPVNRRYGVGKADMVDGYSYFYECSSDSSIPVAKVIQQDKYDETDILAKEKYIEDAFNTYWNTIDETNSENIFCLNQFNSYKALTLKVGGGIFIAGGYDDYVFLWFGKTHYDGVNKRVLDFLKKNNNILGFCAMDFCCDDDAFEQKPYGTALVKEIIRHSFDYVPGAVSASAKTAAFDDTDIEPAEEEQTTEIENVEQNNFDDMKIVEIHDMSGKRINALQPGLNIVKYKNGTIKKIMSK